jgi:hypothetical protein
MPRPGPRRPYVGVRLSVDGLIYIDRLAAAAGVTRSEMIRQLLDEAAAARETKGPKP